MKQGTSIIMEIVRGIMGLFLLVYYLFRFAKA